MNFSSLKLSQKLASALGLIVILFIIAGIFSNLTLKKLGALQDVGAERFQDTQEIGEILARMESFYAIVGDAVINRNLVETNKDLAEFKVQAEKDIQRILEIADTENEKKTASEFKQSYTEYLRLFEKEMLPA